MLEGVPEEKLAYSFKCVAFPNVQFSVSCLGRERKYNNCNSTVECV